MNHELARYNMIEQQIRPWSVLDPHVLDLLSFIKREEFVPNAYHDLAFTDFEIPLLGASEPNTGQHMLAPRVEARILQALAPRKNDTALEIGTGSGYMAALLGYSVHHVTTLEIDRNLSEKAAGILQHNGMSNVEVVNADGAQGWSVMAPYDVIALSGALTALPQKLLEQLKVGGRMVAVVGNAPAMQVQLIKRVSNIEYHTENLFQTLISRLIAPQPSSFKF
ncbi:protein-L-isoaspartate O-methyltransferase family protein [Candidatus Pandoraea novymonadis]|nr:protein-L-isoaspartate O-methyltransferase [Candidatus Pandoraea novymonadis]